MSRQGLVAVIILLLASFTIFAQSEISLVGNPDAGKDKSAICVACHGPDGNSPTPIWPKIAGLSEAYVLKQLLAFKNGVQGERYDPTMYGIVQNMTPQDFVDLAAYYATQQMTMGVARPDNISLGQKLYRGGNLLTAVPACAACHDAAGLGNYLAKIPRLGGQNSQYIVDQLHKFKNMTRGNNMMNDIAKRMTDQEIEAVANYVAGLH